MGPRPETDRLEAKQLRMCLLSKRVEVLRQKSKAPHHRAERAHAEADYDEETARDGDFNPLAGHRTGPGVPTYA